MTVISFLVNQPSIVQILIDILIYIEYIQAVFIILFPLL